MSRTLKVTVPNAEEAMKIAVAFIRVCRNYFGGIPRFWLPGMLKEGGYVGVDVICNGAHGMLRSIRLMAPASDSEWVQILEKMNTTKGDWHWILGEYGQLVPDVETAVQLMKSIGALAVEASTTAPTAVAYS